MVAEVAGCIGRLDAKVEGPEKVKGTVV